MLLTPPVKGEMQLGVPGFFPPDPGSVPRPVRAKAKARAPSEVLRVLACPAPPRGGHVRDKSLTPHLGSPIKPEATGNLYVKQCIGCFRALLPGLVINQHTPSALVVLSLRAPTPHGRCNSLNSYNKT